MMGFMVPAINATFEDLVVGKVTIFTRFNATPRACNMA